MASREEIETKLLTYSDALARELDVIDQSVQKNKQLIFLSLGSHLKTVEIGKGDEKFIVFPTIQNALKGFGPLRKEQLRQAATEQLLYQGYYVYSIPYAFALRPSARISPAVSETKETWLVQFSPDTAIYSAQSAGFIQLFDLPHKRVILIEVSNAEGLDLSEDVHLNKGYWQLEDDSLQSIGKDEYYRRKQQMLEHLSIDDNVPAYLKW